MNSFETGQRKVIPAVLIYARSGNDVLMIHRHSHRKDGTPDYHGGKWNGLGGKLELDESSLEAARREFHEEAGVLLPEETFRSLGIIQFPLFKPHKNEDWLVYVWEVAVDSAARGEIEMHTNHCEEGTLHWVPSQELVLLPMWEGDQYFMSFVLDHRPFIGTVWYQGEKVVRHWIRPMDCVSPSAPGPAPHREQPK